MKNKKGFTLIEILVVIVLVALLLGIGIPGVMKISQNMKKRSLNTKLDLVEQAAILYGQDNKTLLQNDENCKTPDGNVPCKKVSINDLIENDYLSSDNSIGEYKNPEDDSSMLDKCVYIYKKNNRVYAFYSNDTCNTIDPEPPSSPDPEDPSSPAICTSIESESPDLPDIQEEDTLAYKLIDNATIASENNDSIKTQYKDNAPSEIGSYSNGSDERILSTTTDDYGKSYYYRGAVTDNYLNFANMCWRIVRIQGDGSIKLVLEDKDEKCETSNGNWNIGKGNFGYEEYKKPTRSDYSYKLNYIEPSEESFSKSMVNSFELFQTENLKDYLKFLKIENWCMEDIAYENYNIELDGELPLTNEEKYNKFYNYEEYYYRPYIRLHSSSHCSDLKLVTYSCSGKTMNCFIHSSTPMYVGGLTADELFYAGSSRCYVNYNYYLMNEYQKSNSLKWWTISPFMNDSAFVVDDDGTTDFNSGSVSVEKEFRPAIVLKSKILYNNGDGTKTNPYTIKYE